MNRKEIFLAALNGYLLHIQLHPTELFAPPISAVKACVNYVYNNDIEAITSEWAKDNSTILALALNYYRNSLRIDINNAKS